MKRAQGISINVIVITAIALIVLIVLVIVFTGRVQLFGKGLGTCRGSCVTSAVNCNGDSAIPTSNCDDGKSPPIKGDGFCCIPVA
ncbi:MAG TPA: hypothetical protein VLJ21_04910 [Candidatus Binatia bacterium]|nr:hypothetical protein [Candidatus Binatia bacterium]